MAAGGCGRTSALDGHPKVGAGWGELDECGASGIDQGPMLQSHKVSPLCWPQLDDAGGGWGSVWGGRWPCPCLAHPPDDRDGQPHLLESLDFSSRGHLSWATFMSLSDQGSMSRGTRCYASLGWVQHVGALLGLQPCLQPLMAVIHPTPLPGKTPVPSACTPSPEHPAAVVGAVPQTHLLPSCVTGVLLMLGGHGGK